MDAIDSHPDERLCRLNVLISYFSKSSPGPQSSRQVTVRQLMRMFQETLEETVRLLMRMFQETLEEASYWLQDSTHSWASGGGRAGVFSRGSRLPSSSRTIS